MKNYPHLVAMTALIFLLFFFDAHSQNMIANSSFEDATAWTYYNGGTPDEVEFTFPYETAILPAAGSGNACLYVYGEITEGSWINGLLWQQH